MTDTPSAWIGIYSGTSATAPVNYTDYDWYNIKGEPGDVSNHDHDSAYSAIGHDHDSDYSAIGHDHDSDYLGIAAQAADSDKLDGYHASNSTGNIPISNGTVNTNLNADKLDGYDASNATASIPISNGTLNSILNQGRYKLERDSSASGGKPPAWQELHHPHGNDFLDGNKLVEDKTSAVYRHGRPCGCKDDGRSHTDMEVYNPNLLHNWDFRNPVNQRAYGDNHHSGHIFTTAGC